MLRTGAPSVSTILGPDRVVVGLPGETKDDVIDGLLDLLDGAAGVEDLGTARADVFKREAIMSTGVGKGLALPHARSRAVTETVAAFATTARPIDFGSLDGEPVRLVLAIVGPEEDRGTHIKLLSRVSRLMSDDAFRQRLLDARTPARVLAAFREAEEHLA